MDHQAEDSRAERAADERLKETIRKTIDAEWIEGEPTLEELDRLDATIPPEEPPAMAVASPADSEGEPKKRPISPKKLAANFANSDRSTGPKSLEGKNKSRFNAVKYGLTARYFPNLLQEGTSEWEGYQAQRKSLFEHYAPVGPIEEMLVEKIAVETIRLTRLLGREQHPDIVQTRSYWEVIKLDVRYQSAINRQLFEAIKELERRQAERIKKEKAELADGADGTEERDAPEGWSESPN